MTLHWPFRDSPELTKWFSVVGENPYPVGLLRITYAVRRLPYIVRSAASGLAQVSVSLE